MGDLDNLAPSILEFNGPFSLNQTRILHRLVEAQRTTTDIRMKMVFVRRLFDREKEMHYTADKMVVLQ
jgi:hypothetical protein